MKANQTYRTASGGLDRKAVMAAYRRSFDMGVGSIISISGGYFPQPRTSNVSRRTAASMRRNWENVGGYLRTAMKNVQ